MEGGREGGMEYIQFDVPACSGLGRFGELVLAANVLPSIMHSCRLVYVQCTLIILPVFIILCTSIKSEMEGDVAD